MKLSQIFAADVKTMPASEKVTAIAAIVTKARKAYGNGDANIPAPEVHTTEGLQDIAMLSDESKLAIAESEVGNIKRVAVEFTKAFEGAKLDKKIDRKSVV